jgi:hypothetical protein
MPREDCSAPRLSKYVAGGNERQLEHLQEGPQTSYFVGTVH